MTRAVTIIGSSGAINEPWAPSDLFESRGLESADQNFALTDSGRLWPSRSRTEQDTVTSDTSRILRRAAKTQASIELLRSWREGEQAEQRSTLEFLRTSLDKNRIPGSKLFEAG